MSAITQAESLELLTIFAAFGEEDTWMELASLGAFDTPERPLIQNIRFNLRNYGNANAVLDFHFDIEGVCKLGSLFRLPETVITEDGDRCTKGEALAIMLNRMSSPQRLHDMSGKFGRSSGSICRIFLWMIDFVDERYESKLYAPTSLLRRRIHSYCRAIAQRTPVDNVFAFPDGTKIEICRLSPRRKGDRENLQYQVYSGRKRCYCLTFQGLTAPDGICIHFWGPYEGRRYDTTVFTASGIIGYFNDHTDIFSGYSIFGDPAYTVSDYVVTGFRQSVLSTHEEIFIKDMSAVRVAVEWNFGLTKGLWPLVDYKKKLRLRLSPVGKIVRVAMLLTNCHCCRQGGNQISFFFNLGPPTLEEYLAGK